MRRLTFRHNPGCPGSNLTERLRADGHIKVRCAACNSFLIVYAHKSTEADPLPDHLRTSRYRCADHPDRPVTWRGTGCPECTQERAARRTTHPEEIPA